MPKGDPLRLAGRPRGQNDTADRIFVGRTYSLVIGRNAVTHDPIEADPDNAPFRLVRQLTIGQDSVSNNLLRQTRPGHRNRGNAKSHQSECERGMQHGVANKKSHDPPGRQPQFQRRPSRIMNRFLQRGIIDRRKLCSRRADRRNQRIDFTLEENGLDDVHIDTLWAVIPMPGLDPRLWRSSMSPPSLPTSG